MTITITIKTGNAAFEPDPGTEVARILRDYADEVEGGWPAGGVLLDANGNVVGSVKVKGG